MNQFANLGRQAIRATREFWRRAQPALNLNRNGKALNLNWSVRSLTRTLNVNALIQRLNIPCQAVETTRSPPKRAGASIGTLVDEGPKKQRDGRSERNARP
ncbi:hypothetical protein BLTE_19720 [Blastochloris tepida]|uniref:Uncharacterized protein n=1 Tax=Blastochloris tepida TaxID=2233851 RepID=A0A348G154_9HYPH|nr:hypothetical protein BLTE_19720 [Blastochloris tepida]